MFSLDDHKLVVSFIADHNTAMLTSIDGAGLRSRPMHIVQKSYSGTIYFYAPADSEVFTEIIKSSQVNVAFSDNGTGRYLSLSGRAGICSDKNLYGEMWNEEMDTWFPNGAEGGEALLMEIKVMQGESWQSKGKLVRLYERVKAKATSSSPELSEHHKFDS